jgi:hypothetical protein
VTIAQTLHMKFTIPDSLTFLTHSLSASRLTALSNPSRDSIRDMLNRLQIAWLVLKVDSITFVSSFVAGLGLASTTLLLVSRYHDKNFVHLFLQVFGGWSWYVMSSRSSTACRRLHGQMVKISSSLDKPLCLRDPISQVVQASCIAHQLREQSS